CRTCISIVTGSPAYMRAPRSRYRARIRSITSSTATKIQLDTPSDNNRNSRQPWLFPLRGVDMSRIRLASTALLFLVMWVPAHAQSDRGVLTGTVTDNSGAVIPGATVTATNAATNVTASTVTTEGGLYAIPALPPGTYKLRVELTGFKAYEQSGIVV